MPSKKKKYNARFPAGRIKKIMQSDEEVGKVAQAVPIIISRTLELFVESLLNKTLRVTSARNAKTLSPSHMRQCIMSENRFDFLRELVKNVPDINVEEQLLQQHGGAASTSTLSGTAAGCASNSDSDVEFVSGSSTPTTSIASYALPTDLSSRSAAAAVASTSAAAFTTTSTQHSNGHTPQPQPPPPPSSSIYFNSMPQPQSSAEHSLDLSTTGRSAIATTAPITSMAANYYTEIDMNTLPGGASSSSISAKSSPTAGAAANTVHSALHRSASTPSANFYIETNNRPINLTPVTAAAAVVVQQPPVINFDFSKGLANSSIRYTTPTATNTTTINTQAPASTAGSTVLNVAIDQLTMTPLVKIDYSQLAFAAAAAAVASASTHASATTASSIASSALPEIVKPKRGRPPKVRLPVGVPAGMTSTPSSAPPTACAPYTPIATSFGGGGGSSSHRPTADDYAKSTHRYQKHAAKRSRRASSGGAHIVTSTLSGGSSGAAAIGAAVTTTTLSASRPTQMPVTPIASMPPLAVVSSSCLDMDEDYDNI